MAQVERVEDMEVGDFIVLPSGEWHTNHAAKAVYAKAQQLMRDYLGEGPRPQYSVESGPQPECTHRIERIR